LTAKVTEDVSVDEAWMIAVDDVYFGDVGDGGVLFKESLCVVSLRFVLGLFTLRQVMTSACASHDSLEVVDEELAKGCPGVDDAFRKGILPKEWCRLQCQRKVCDFCSIITTCHIDCLGIDLKPLMWRCLAVVHVETEWVEAFEVDVKAELSPESQEMISVAWSSVSFLQGARFLPGIDNLPCVIPYSCKVAKVNGRGVL